MFGDKIPTASREDIIRGLTDDATGQEDLGQQGRGRLGDGDDGREADDGRGQGNAGSSQANQPQYRYRTEQDLLASYTEAEIRERQARIEAVEKKQAKLHAELRGNQAPFCVDCGLVRAWAGRE